MHVFGRAAGGSVKAKAKERNKKKEKRERVGLIGKQKERGVILKGKLVSPLLK